MASSSEHDNPGPAEPSSNPADATRTELTAAIDNLRQGFDGLEQTWDNGIREMLRRLDEMQLRTYEIVKLVTDNYAQLQRVAARPRHPTLTLGAGEESDSSPKSGGQILGPAASRMEF